MFVQSAANGWGRHYMEVVSKADQYQGVGERGIATLIWAATSFVRSLKRTLRTLFGVYLGNCLLSVWSPELARC